jgi:hypothetical protein
MANLSVNVRARMEVSWYGNHEFGGPVFNQIIEQALPFTNGTGALQADLFWADERTLNASTADLIDLTALPSQLDGTTINMVHPVAVLVINAPRNSSTANAGNLLIGGTGNTYAGFFNAATNGITPLRPGGMFLVTAPDATGFATPVDSSSDLLRIYNSHASASNTYQICILGRSA